MHELSNSTFGVVTHIKVLTQSRGALTHKLPKFKNKIEKLILYPLEREKYEGEKALLNCNTGVSLPNRVVKNGEPCTHI